MNEDVIPDPDNDIASASDVIEESSSQGAPIFETIDSAIKVYVDVRDQLRVKMREAKAYEVEMKSKMDEISMWLRDKADELGVDSFKTSHGTAYRNKKESYRIMDWDAFVEFIKETDNFQLLEKRVAKNAAREVHRDRITQNDDILARNSEVKTAYAGQEALPVLETEIEPLPPGLDYFAEVEFNVLRPKKS